MGLGRFHYPGLGTLSALSAGGGADLQLVELVCAAGKSQSQIGGHHQPAVSALCGGAPDHSWWRSASHHHLTARSGQQSAIDADGYSCPNEPIQSSCGAVEN